MNANHHANHNANHNANKNHNNSININVDLASQSISQHQKEIDISSNSSSNSNKQMIRLYSFLLQNSIDFSEKIRQLLCGSSTRFDVIVAHKFVQLGHVNKYTTNTLEYLKTDKKHVLCEYNIRNNSIPFDEFLITCPTPKTFIFHVLDTYSYLLNSLLLLNSINVCFYNVSAENIVIDKNFKPILQNFDLCLNFDCHLRFSEIMKHTTDYTHKPFEVHVLFYLIMKQNETLTEEMIQKICSVYIQNSAVFSLLQEDNKKKYRDECVDFLQQYKEKPRDVIILDVLRYVNTWDNYSCSVIYLHIVTNIVQVFDVKAGFLTSFINILQKTVHPNPSQRISLKDTLLLYKELYSDFKDWSFINAIPPYKIVELHKSLSY